MFSRATDEKYIGHLSNIYRTSIERTSVRAPSHPGSSPVIHSPPHSSRAGPCSVSGHSLSRHQAARCIPHPVLGGGVHHLLNVLPLSAWARSSSSNEHLSNIYRISSNHLPNMYRTPTEHSASGKYRTTARHRSNIDRTSIEQQ